MLIIYAFWDILPFSVFLPRWAHPSSPEHYPSLLHVPRFDPAGHYPSTPSAPFMETGMTNTACMNLKDKWLKKAIKDYTIILLTLKNIKILLNVVLLIAVSIFLNWKHYSSWARQRANELFIITWSEMPFFFWSSKVSGYITWSLSVPRVMYGLWDTIRTKKICQVFLNIATVQRKRMLLSSKVLGLTWGT